MRNSLTAKKTTQMFYTFQSNTDDKNFGIPDFFSVLEMSTSTVLIIMDQTSGSMKWPLPCSQS